MKHKFPIKSAIAILFFLLVWIAVPLAAGGLIDDWKGEAARSLGIIDFHFEDNVLHADGPIVITSGSHTKRKVKNGIVRGGELNNAVSGFISNSKRSADLFFQNQNDAARASRDRLRNKAKDDNKQISHLIQSQKNQQRLQRSRMRDVKRLARDGARRNKDLLRDFRR